MVMTVKNSVCFDVVLLKFDASEESNRLHYQDVKNQRARNNFTRN
jgi:hypothetical protein